MAEMKRVALNPGFKAGMSVTETLVLVQKDYKNEALNQSNVFRGYSQFQDSLYICQWSLL
jgi:hypothetical protein